jgi:MFS transporter, DHA1 family, multidrug resistance protein
VMIVLTRLNIKLVRRYSPQALMKTGLLVQLAAGLVLTGLAQAHSGIIPVFGVMTLYVGILGIIFGNGVASALEFFKHDSGVASSVIGVTEFTIAGAVGFGASVIHTGTLTPVFALMAATAFAAVLALSLSRE